MWRNKEEDVYKMFMKTTLRMGVGNLPESNVVYPQVNNEEFLKYGSPKGLKNLYTYQHP